MTSNPLDTVLGGRQKVRHLKRWIRTGNSDTAAPAAPEISRSSIVELLANSMRFGQERLALRHLMQALNLGAALNEGHWKYCSSVASKC